MGLQWSRYKGVQVNCRVGTAYGKCTGGIAGSSMQRYHLFGKLMTDVELLESTAPEGRVQVSTLCKEKLLERGAKAFLFEDRTDPHLATSKGDRVEYAEVEGQ